jgi:4-hydroxy-tetrahydrodipicolinate synthase
MDASTVKERVKDVCVVVATPFDDRLELDLKGFADNVSYLARSGIRTILVGGNTGEFYALTDAELLSLTEVARAQARSTARSGGWIGLPCSKTAVVLPGRRYARASGKARWI